MKKWYLSALVSFVSSVILTAQPMDPVTWSFSSEKVSDNHYELVFSASIDPPWHLYSAYLPEGGPIPTRPYYDETAGYELVDDLIEATKPKVKFDPGFKMQVGTIAGKAEFRQKVKVTGTAPVTVSGEIEYQVCDDANCLPPNTEPFSFTFAPDPAGTPQATADAVSREPGESPDGSGKGKATKEEGTSPEVQAGSGNPVFEVREATIAESAEETFPDVPAETAGTTDDRSLWTFFWIAFGAGLLALLTPCVFPMIPMTVSFFMQGSENRARAVLRGSVFGISIIAIYTLLGVIVSLTNLGPNAANALSTNWIINLIFFLLFVLFAFSFLGMFELVLPSKWVNKADSGADRGGLGGAFFMALTTVLVSFSCTGPIVGALLVEAAGGLALKPILGMFGFALAFAIPFTLFAIFPSMLKGLPKSGGWLNSVKVVLGFIVLAFSFKFLQPLDPGHNIISRELVLSVWTVLFFLLGMYLLGKLKFAHDSDLPYVSVPRLLLAIASFVFALFMFMGIFGAPLKTVAPLLPPKSNDWIDLTQRSVAGGNAALPVFTDEECTPEKHVDLFSMPYNLTAFYDLEEGLACAEKTGKPVFIDFKGHFCSNCKRMEESVWSDPTVQSLLRNEFVIVALYTDDRTKLPEEEWYTSRVDGKVKKTIGQQNVDYEIEHFGTNTIPLYVIMDSEGNVVNEPRGTDLDVASYTAWLKEGIAAAGN
jgi:thiol:disulfide interchange protein DsbD